MFAFIMFALGSLLVYAAEDILRRLVGGDSPEDVGDDIGKPVVLSPRLVRSLRICCEGYLCTGDLLNIFSDFMIGRRDTGGRGTPHSYSAFKLTRKVNRAGYGASGECDIRAFAHIFNRSDA
jgi:hypothetical protein